jgi:hypothetical protein
LVIKHVPRRNEAALHHQTPPQQEKTFIVCQDIADSTHNNQRSPPNRDLYIEAQGGERAARDANQNGIATGFRCLGWFKHIATTTYYAALTLTPAAIRLQYLLYPHYASVQVRRWSHRHTAVGDFNGERHHVRGVACLVQLPQTTGKKHNNNGKKKSEGSQQTAHEELLRRARMMTVWT